MRTIKKQTVVYNTKEIYVAVDGKEFENKEACVEYEKTRECTLKASFNKIPSVKSDVYLMGLGDYMSDCTVYIVKPRNKTDIEVINEYYAAINSYNSDNCILTYDDINTEIIVVFGYDIDWISIFRLKEHAAKLANNFKEVVKQLNGGEE